MSHSWWWNNKYKAVILTLFLLLLKEAGKEVRGKTEQSTVSTPLPLYSRAQACQAQATPYFSTHFSPRLVPSHADLYSAPALLDTEERGLYFPLELGHLMTNDNG